jgi:hypothetical protein
MSNQHRCFWGETILLVSLLGLATVPAMGQGISLGFRGGLNSATESFSGDAGVDIKSRTTFHLGGIVSIGIQETFALQIEGILSKKGFAFDEAGVAGAFEVSYLQIPILAKVIVPTPPTSPVTPHFFAGPNLGFEVSCNVTGEGGGVSVSVECDEGGLETKALDFGLLFGGGLSIGKGPVSFLVDVAYDFGLSNIDDTSGSSDTIRNRTFMASVGLMFPIR